MNPVAQISTKYWFRRVGLLEYRWLALWQPAPTKTNVPGRVYWQDSTTGFEAAAYVKGSEVVVSFAGTYFEGELKPDMFDNNVPLGGGKLTDQLRQAAEFVVRLKQNPAMAGKSMVLTGHSLGGAWPRPSA